LYRGREVESDRQVRELRYDRAIALGLEDRIVSDAGSERGPRI
jgi:hypothetical protein